MEKKKVEKTFEVSGSFKIGRTMQKFRKEIRSPSEKMARIKTYCDFGSRHKVKRKDILIDEVKEK